MIQLLAVGSLLASPVLFAAGEGKVTISVIDQQTRQPIAARMHLLDPRSRPVIPPKSVAWRDHFVFDGHVTLELDPGAYSFVVERGPEYRIRFGNLMVGRNSQDAHQLEMERFVDMKHEGWWCGDLHVHRPPADIELLMRAEDLHIAPVITWWNNRNAWSSTAPPANPVVQFDGNRLYHVLAGEDEREGGALLFFNLPRPLPIQNLSREYPSGASFLSPAREHPQVHIDMEKPFWWDMPMWVATGQVDSVGLANNHLWRDGGLHTEAWGKPRDKVFYPDPHGNGRWSQDIYYHLLNCGLRIPPSAGSASGVLNNPVGYNRVYVHCGEELSWEKWWQGLREGKVVVTNGPLLRPRVNGQLPGHVFTANDGESVSLDVTLELAFRDPVEYLEIVQDGKVLREVKLTQLANQRGKIPPVVFERSGWMLVRAVTSAEKTYRFGSTGPYYVQIGQQPRISRSSAQFFLDWVRQRAARIKLDDASQREAVIAFHRQARDYWQNLVDRANAD
jgi:hypothetical protein